jgi:ubiquitin
VKSSKFDVWVKKILATEDEEISCSECFDLLSEYVEVEVSHTPVQKDYGKLKQHLLQCQVCRDEYEILRDLARMDAEGEDISEEG